MLKIWVLSVGHGDSIVIEHGGPDGKSHAVIDCNKIAGQHVPPALSLLDELQAERLSFASLTHPHKDHYSGMIQIMRRYPIAQFFSYPFTGDVIARLAQFKTLIDKHFKATKDASTRASMTELVEIIHHLKNTIGLDNCEEITGPYNQIFPEGFSDVDIYTLTPLAKIKSDIFKVLETGDMTFLESSAPNNLSLSFILIYSGVEIILGGDATAQSWLDHKKQLERQQKGIKAHIVKLPHHGSKYECTDEVLQYLFKNEGERIALISANGKSHPHPDTIRSISKMGIKPYCTHLARICGANIVQSFRALPEINPELRRYINTIDDADIEQIQPCQGNILITVQSNGTYTIERELDHPCPYRGDYDGLAA